MTALPRILVIDDLFGRQNKDCPNRERANLCGMYSLRDVTGDEVFPSDEEVVTPIADAVFFRGQRPLFADVGDSVENDLEATLATVRQSWGTDAPDMPHWALVLLDLCFYTGQVTVASNKSLVGMPEGRPDDDVPRWYFGLRILERLHAEFPDLPVIILSSKQREEVSQSFTAFGALGFIPRTASDGPQKLRDYLWRHGLTPDASGQIIGSSRSLLLALRSARRAAADRRNILIRGERGAGKELLAAYINHSVHKGRNDKPLVTVDSGTLTPALFASELFGHIKGAYTGADRERQGRIVQANRGDLFLDEIGNMPPDVQNGLLRVIETRLVYPLGSSAGIEVDVRFIAATNEDIELKAASGGGFRADLLDRLREGGTIILPPLRDRRSDIPLLAEQFVRQAEAARLGTMTRTISPEAMDKLLAYHWPGNIRELRNCILKAVNDHPDIEHLVPDHLVFSMNPVLVDASSLVNKSAIAKHTFSVTVGDLASTADTGLNIAELVWLLDRADINPADIPGWAGKWPDLQLAYAGITVKFLKAALQATRRITPQNPHGEIKVHPAIKLLTNDSTITASKAADMVKRIFSTIPEPLRTEVSCDPILKAAHDKAIHLRPKKSQKNEK